MTYFNYDPALESELDYRHGALQRDADADRLARQARLGSRGARAARRLLTGSATRTAKPAVRAA